MIFDSHAHYDDDRFEADRGEVLSGLKEAGVDTVVNCAVDFETAQNCIELTEKYNFIYSAIGFHPESAGKFWGTDEVDLYELNEEQKAQARCYGLTKAELLERLAAMAEHEKVLAIGEIGLDYYWDAWPREMQQEVFLRQWELAIKLGKPIQIHSRDAAEDTMKLVKKMYEAEKKAGRELRADMHCYSYSVEQAREYLKMGLYFGVGGVVTYNNGRKLQEVVAELPLERILLETDCPYMTPVPFRSKRNYSGYLNYVAEKIAEIKGIDVETVYRVTTENAQRFFDVKL